MAVFPPCSQLIVAEKLCKGRLHKTYIYLYVSVYCFMYVAWFIHELEIVVV